MLDQNGNVCEYDGYAINPSEYKSSEKTLEELQKEAEALYDEIMRMHSEDEST